MFFLSCGMAVLTVLGLLLGLCFPAELPGSIEVVSHTPLSHKVPADLYLRGAAGGI